MAVESKLSALSRVASDPVSRRKLLAVTGGSTALAAFLAACGGDDDSTTSTMTSAAGGKTGTEKFGKGDVGILNFALTLEYLEAAFYKEAKSRAGASGDLKRLIETIARDEDEHIGALTETIKKLGGKPVAEPKFDFPYSTPPAFSNWPKLSRTPGQRLQRRRASDQVKGSAGSSRLDRPGRGTARGGDQAAERRGALAPGLRPDATQG